VATTPTFASTVLSRRSRSRRGGKVASVASSPAPRRRVGLVRAQREASSCCHSSPRTAYRRQLSPLGARRHAFVLAAILINLYPFDPDSDGSRRHPLPTLCSPSPTPTWWHVELTTSGGWTVRFTGEWFISTC
jgi:hypothetical protein